MKSILTTRVSVSIENGSFQRFGRECYRIYVDLKSILTMMLFIETVGIRTVTMLYTQCRRHCGAVRKYSK